MHISSFSVIRIDVTGNDTNNDDGTKLGNETPCGICGDGLSITVTDATIKIPDSIGLLAQQGDITCEMAEGFCMSGACTPETCAEFARDINEACGCAPGSGGGGEDEPDTTIDGDPSSLDILGAAAAAGNFKTLISALGAAELVDALSAPGPYTVFAPTDDAFDALSDGLVDCLLEEENKGTLLSLVTYHVVIGEVLSADLTDGMTVATLQGEDVTVDLSDGGNGKINNSNIGTADIITKNGVIHAIDAVLVPPSIDLDAFLLTCDGGGDGTTPDTAMMQECNICGGSLQVINADALIPIPEESNFPGLENADATEATCGFVQNLCETGFCSTKICAELTTEGTKETCGCDELEI